MTFEEYLARWSRTHGDAQATALIRVWLRFAFSCATPFVRMNANVITCVGGVLALSLATLSVVIQPSAWLLAATIFILGLLDSIDGIVAIRSGQTTPQGGFLDSVIDRIVDASIAVMLWSFGAPLAIILIALTLTLVHEYMRARASGLGFTDIGIVTLSEKPTRIAIGVMFFLAVSFYPRLTNELLLIASYTWLAVAAIGFIQLAVTYRKLINFNG